MHGYTKRKPEWKGKKPGQSRRWDGEWRGDAPGGRNLPKKEKRRSQPSRYDDDDDCDEDGGR